MPLFSQQQRFRTEPEPAGAAASQLLRRYRPLETRATGGFGSVEICLDARLQRRVAIKRIPLAASAGAASAQATAAALAEARTASMLQHPNIVSVIDFTYDAAFAYLVMEYVDGMSLEEFLAQVEGSSLTYDEAACIADALAQALAFAHENGVLHLDIKPANVLIDRNGHVKLADFGMATLASAAGFGGARGGTIGYMPPEQLKGLAVDERADVFGLAAVLYEALCGTAPFRAGTPADSLARIEQGVLYPSDLLPDIPGTAEDALLAALVPEPPARTVSVAAFADEFLAQLGSAREGRKSLARLIARLTSDELDEEQQNDGARPHGVWELDPALGYLGSRWPNAAHAAVGGVGGACSAAVLWHILETMGVANPLARLLAALAIGAAAGAAPQLGSALVLTALIVMVVSATAPLLALIPVAVVLAALSVGWWLTWGRALPAASAALTGILAALLTPGAPLLSLAPFAAFAGFFLPGASAAAPIAFGVPLAVLARAARADGGALPLDAALDALGDPAAWIATAGLSLLAVGIAALLARARDRWQNGHGATPFILAYLLPAPVLALLGCLANPMEIGALDASTLAAAVGFGLSSSIIMWIFTYLFGYGTPTEGDGS